MIFSKKILESILSIQINEKILLKNIFDLGYECSKYYGNDEWKRYKFGIAVDINKVKFGKSIIKSEYNLKKNQIVVVKNSKIYTELDLNLSKKKIIPKISGKFKNFYEYMIEDDFIFEVDIPHNRADLLSHFGLARELAIFYNLNFKKISNKKVKNNIVANNCNSYFAAYVNNINFTERNNISKILNRLNIRSINGLVDISNFAMIKYGLPTHFFDSDKIEGEIFIRKGNNEKIILLHDEEVIATKNDIVISDEKKIIALAGVMGCKNSAVTEYTKNILIEIASFEKINNDSIETEASKRYKKGTDYEINRFVLKEILKLLKKKFFKLLEFQKKIVKQKIVFDLKECNRYLSTNINIDFVKKTLNKLSLSSKIKNTKIQVTVPSFRYDLKREVDIYEELIRFWGYNKIKKEKIKIVKNFSNNKDIVYECKNILRYLSFDEVINYSLVSEKSDFFVLNPMGSMKYFRSSLIFSLLKNIKYNLNKNIKDIKIFEISKIYNPDVSTNIGMAICGSVGDILFQNKRKFDFFDIKGYVEKFLKYLKVNFKFKKEKNLCLSIISNNKKIGYLHQIKRNCLSSYEIKEDVYFCEIFLSEINLNESFTINKRSKFPSIKKGLSLTVENHMNCEDLIKYIKNYNKKIEKVELIDLYEKINYSFLIYFINYKRTMLEKEAEQIIKNLINDFEKIGVYLRK